jgi:hypothetical protein
LSTRAGQASSITHDAKNKSTTNTAGNTGSRLTSLWSYAALGLGAALLLAIIELVDSNIRFSALFESVAERAVFVSYLSLNLLGGAILGAFVWLSGFVFGALTRIGTRAIGGRTNSINPRFLLAGLIVSGVFAVCFNQQPQIHGHAFEIIREAEKFETLTTLLLNHERATSYLLVMVFVVCAASLWTASSRLRSAGALSRLAASVLLGVFILATYYIDSRFETPLYATSIHRSMFVIDTALAMAFIAIMLPTPRGLAKSGRRSVATLAFVLIAAVAFTFFNIDKNQNLKTHVFYRTTQAKQYFKLTQWVLDFDRDGYSAVLGGGDCDDRRADINPGCTELIDAGVDRNCIRGPLSQQDVNDWKSEHRALHPAADPSRKRYNLIYVFIDACRADHLSAYGYSRKTSPNLDKLAARSSLFENAFTPAPNTFEALPKFTQGAYWDAHLEAWPEIMARNGYNALLFPRRISTLRRHVKGMKVVQNSTDGTFEGTIDSAIDVLGKTQKDKPFCAYLYSTDTHRPYRPHEQFAYGSSINDLYDGEISYLDFHLGRLFDWLAETGRADDTMIVIMADHGESLGERGVFKHSTLLYNEQTHVPLIIHVPGIEPRVVNDYVSTVDLSPTILNAVGLDYPMECAGVSLVPLMRGEQFVHPPVYGEQTTQETSPYVRPDQYVSRDQKKYMIISQDGFKLIYNRDQYCFELFNLKEDPKELRNIYDRLPQTAAELRSRLGRFVDVVSVSRPADADETQYFFGPTGEVREAK